MNVVRLSPASPAAGLRALQEVEEFASTDMGWGGEDKWTYRMLSEEQITPELLRLSQHEKRGRVDCTWDLPGGKWNFSGVFDGHAGHSAVDFVTQHLPLKVRHMLQSALSRGPASSSIISKLLNDAIIEIDNAMTLEFLGLFPGGREKLSQLSEREIASVLSRSEAGLPPQIILRCLQGSTALLTLVDPSGSHLWVANLGDCRAVLVSKSVSGTFYAHRLAEVHNGGNPREIRRVVNEHPGERECVLDKRVLGFLAPTRALGDTWMKLPAMYSRRILMKTKEFRAAGLSEDHVKRIKSPPYISNKPDIHYRRLRRGVSQGHPHYAGALTGGGGAEVDVALILCSDGLVDLYEDQDFEEEDYLERWATTIGEVICPPLLQPCFLAPPHARSGVSVQAHLANETQGHGSRANLAVHLLRDAIGGDDIHRASANLTVEMDERWMDDTTILVHRFS